MENVKRCLVIVNPTSGRERAPKYIPLLSSVLSKRYDDVSIKLTQKAGVDGRLFGSVGTADIAEAITATGIEVKKAEVRLPEGPFKAIGEYEVEVALHHDVVVNITVTVVGAAA